MAENSRSTREAALMFMDKVNGILQNVTPEIMDKLFHYLQSADVHSEADIDKVDESKLADVVGNENARTLLDYFKKQKPTTVEAPSTSATTSSLPPAATGVTTISCRPSDGSEGNLGMLEMVMRMHERDSQMVMESQKHQAEALKAVTAAMSQMSTSHKETLDKISEQMTQQSSLHKETIEGMNKHMTATAEMHGKTLETMQRGMTEAQKMNSDTLAHVTSTMTTALEGQEKRMEQSSRNQSQMHQEAIRAMNAHLQSTNQMHADTLRTVQHSMTEAQRMNATNLTQVSSAMNAVLEAQEQTMREYRQRLAEKDESACRLM